MPDLTQRAFDALLAWLDPDRELAGEKYEDIRYRLIKFFERRGCPAPEELADEVLNRVSKKLDEGTEVRAFEYFYGVALRVFHEHLEKPRTQPPASLSGLLWAPIPRSSGGLNAWNNAWRGSPPIAAPCSSSITWGKRGRGSATEKTWPGAWGSLQWPCAPRSTASWKSWSVVCEAV